MERNFNDVLMMLDVHNISDINYYKLTNLDDILTELGNFNIVTEELIITPFYICNRKTLELYYHELNIRLVDIPSADNFILNKTGKVKLKNIKPKVERNLRRCYLEVVKPNTSFPSSKLKEFIEYVINSPEVKNDAMHCFHEFNTDNLYFEVY